MPVLGSLQGDDPRLLIVLRNNFCALVTVLVLDELLVGDASTSAGRGTVDGCGGISSSVVSPSSAEA